MTTIRNWLDLNAGSGDSNDLGMGPKAKAAQFRFAGGVFTVDEILPKFQAACESGWKCPEGMEASVPKEWEPTVKKLKKHPEVDNPFALVNWMDRQGYTPGGKD